MATAPLRRRAGRIEIDLKEERIRKELKARHDNQKPEEPISKEEHDRRLKMLKSLGILKE